MPTRSFWKVSLVASLIVQCSTHAAIGSRLLLPSKADQSKGIPTKYHTKKSFKHFKQFSVYVPMKDGTKIATEVYLPQPLPSGSTLPVMFEQSRYWRVLSLKFPLNNIYSKPLSLFRSQFLTHGYAWVVTDTRGSGASSGARPWEFCPLDIADSKEVMEWILKQPWSNGKIGTIGHSYSGNLAELAVLSDLPNIKAAAVLSSPFDLYSNDLRPGGLALEPFIGDWCKLTQSFDNNKFPDSMKAAGYVLKGIRPVDGADSKQVLKSILAARQPNLSSAMFDKVCFRDDQVLNQSGSNSPDFARGISILKQRYGDKYQNLGLEVSSPSGFWKDGDKMKVPIYAVAGWLEGANAEAAIDRFNNYTTPGSRLLLGPWDHNLFNISPFTRGGPTKFIFTDELLKFFDQHLKEKSSIPSENPVSYYTLGEEKWHSASSFPPDTARQKLYLGAQNALTPQACDTAGGDEYKNNNSVGTGKDTRWDCMLGNVLFNPYPDVKKADKKRLLYETEALQTATKITGSPRCNFFLETDGPDCAVFVYLEDVTPQGKVHYVTEGELLCGHRATPEAEQDYKSLLPARTFKKKDYRQIKTGEITEVAIGMLPVSYQFKKGHRIRLSVCSADRDHFKLPPSISVGKAFTIHRGPGASSSIELPTDE